MRIQRIGLAGVLGVAALLAGAGAARAQSAPQVVQMGPGIVLVVPVGAAVQSAAAPMPDPTAMIAQMNAQMAQMNAQMQAQLQQAAAMQAAMPAATGSYSGVVVTSFSDGQHSCTERVVYPANGSAAQVQVSETGNACGALGSMPGVTPAAAPLRPVPLPASTAPYLRKSPDLVVADNN